ncbi:hypothetical protein [Kitasatospora sp. NPDC098663]|uniref:hypothetical protein n=1 Tax=Kitasatospora sp. NPDC098663 TaxID=3364096 RepID=UPI0038232A89
MSDPPVPREVNVNVVPAEGYQLEIAGALSDPHVAADDIDRHFEQVIADAVRRELFIPDDVPLVLIITDSDGDITRAEQPSNPK